MEQKEPTNLTSKNKAPQKARRRYASEGVFEKIAELNRLIDQGGEVAKDARAAKARLSAKADFPSKKAKKKGKGKKKKADILDSRMRVPGSFESGNNR